MNFLSFFFDGMTPETLPQHCSRHQCERSTNLTLEIKMIQRRTLLAGMWLVCCTSIPVAIAARPCDRDAGECRSQDMKRNTQYEGMSGVCMTTSTSKQGGKVITLTALSPSGCARDGGVWYATPKPSGGGSDGGSPAREEP